MNPLDTKKTARMVGSQRQKHLKLKERFYYRRLVYILKNWPQYKEEIHRSSSRYNEVTEAALKLQCERYKEGSVQTADGLYGIMSVIYEHSKYTSMMGRLYGKGGKWKKGGLTLQNIPRAVRHTIARDLYWDLDLENAMPSLMAQWAQKHGLVLPNLNSYRYYRKDMLEEVTKATGLTFSEGKRLVCKLFNDGRIPKDIREKMPAWFLELEREIQQLIQFVKENEPELWAYSQEVAQKKFDDRMAAYKEGKRAEEPWYHPEGTLMSLLYGDLEDKCLMAMHDMLEGRGLIKKGFLVLVFDGIMLPIPPKSAKVTQEQLCLDLAAAVLQATGYEVKLVVKEMDEGLDIPDDDELELEEMEVEEALEGEKNELFDNFGDKTAARACATELAGLHYYCALTDRWWTTKANNIWNNTPQPVSLDDQVFDILNPLVTQEIDSRGPTKKLLKCQSMINDLNFRMRVIKSMRNCPEIRRDAFIELLDQNPYVFAFEDCLYDFRTNTFREIKREDYITITTGYNKPQPNPYVREKIQAAVASMFLKVESCEYFLLTTASSVFGRNLWQQFLFWTGNGGNGKSLIVSLIKVAFGNLYYKDIRPQQLTKPKRSANDHDELSELKGSRIVTAEESEPTDSLQEGEAKRMTGGNGLKGRTCGDKPLSYIPQFTFFFICNQLPGLHQASESLRRRISVIHFEVQFKYARDLEPGNPYIKLRDDSLEDLFKSQEYGQEFMLYLLDIYRENVSILTEAPVPPETHASKTEDYFQTADPMQAWVKSTFVMEKPRNNKHKVPATRMTELYDMTGPVGYNVKTWMEQNGFVYKNIRLGSLLVKGYAGLREKTQAEMNKETTDGKDFLKTYKEYLADPDKDEGLQTKITDYVDEEVETEYQIIECPISTSEQHQLGICGCFDNNK